MITENERAHGSYSASAAGDRLRVTEPSRLTDGRSLGDIIAETQTDFSNIVRKEIQLAKAEVKVDAAKAGKGAGFLGAAAVLGIFGLNLLLFTLAFVLDIWLPRWAAFGIITLIVLATAGFLALMGKKALTTVNPKPTRTIRNAQETVEAVKVAAKPSA